MSSSRITEYISFVDSPSRIVVPITMDEMKCGELYMTSKSSDEVTSDKEGIECITSESFNHGGVEGYFTHKIIHVNNTLPDWLSRLLPGDVVQIEEKSWNTFPIIKTEYSVDSSIIGNSVKIHVKTIMVEDDGSSDNVHDLPLSMLKHRKVDHIDIAFDTLTSTWGPWNGGELNVRDFQSQKMKPVRGPLRPGWRTHVSPRVCAYKLVIVDFNSAFSFIRRKGTDWTQHVVRNVYLHTYSQIYCWMDEWCDLSFQQIREMDIEIANKLKERNDVQKFEKKRRLQAAAPQSKRSRLKRFLKSAL